MNSDIRDRVLIMQREVRDVQILSKAVGIEFNYNSPKMWTIKNIFRPYSYIDITIDGHLICLNNSCHQEKKVFDLTDPNSINDMKVFLRFISKLGPINFPLIYAIIGVGAFVINFLFFVF